MMSRLKTLWMLPVIALALAACSDSNNNGGTGPTPVAAPTNLTVTQNSLTSLQVSWTAASGATAPTSTTGTTCTAGCAGDAEPPDDRLLRNLTFGEIPRGRENGDDQKRDVDNPSDRVAVPSE